MNSMSFEEGITVEIILKFSPEWNVDYNRWQGLFSRQGVAQDESVFSVGTTTLSEDTPDGNLGKDGTIGFQYVHIEENGNGMAKRVGQGMVGADKWYHIMVTRAPDEDTTKCYINGEFVVEFDDGVGISQLDPSFGWDIGVGRKEGEGAATMNERYPEGLIRRLFCGTMSEIRVSKGYMEVEDSLIKKSTEYDLTPFIEIAEEPEPAAAETETSGKAVIAPATYDPGIYALIAAAVSFAGLALSKKH